MKVATSEIFAGAIGIATDGVFSIGDVRDLNAYLRAYHLGFEICDYRLLNEDGNPNVSLKSVQ